MNRAASNGHAIRRLRFRVAPLAIQPVGNGSGRHVMAAIVADQEQRGESA
jgi:hypothetical protein